MSDALSIGVDATFLARDKRGMGRCIRSILKQWKVQCDHKIVLLTRDKRHLGELEDYSASGWECHLASQSPPLDVCWFAWNRVDWEVDCPAAVTIYDVAPFTDYHPQNRHLESDQERLRQAAEAADRIITTSNFSRVELHRHLGYDLANIDVIPLGVDPVFHPHRDGFQDAFFVEHVGEQPYILFVGNPEPRKNLEGLLEAFVLLESQVECNLVLVCNRPAGPTIVDRLRGKSSSLLEHINRLADRLIWLEGIEDQTLAELYRRCAVFVMPSFYEGFGLPVLEALGCGATVAAARAASLPEVGGDIPYWFDPSDPVDIARAVMEALENPNGDEGPARAAQFRWSETARQLQEILEGMASHGVSV
ncbi:MAG: glycosyltransferase family 4 protein, partial [Candidatus Eremiobacteraeota bacterium]|nr:glycosyltransferase family 4 protein [Candidatus Eremiobacteraeota bacterium]